MLPVSEPRGRLPRHRARDGCRRGVFQDGAVVLRICLFHYILLHCSQRSERTVAAHAVAVGSR